MTVTYNSGLVVLSVLIAILVSYVALDIASRIAQSEGRASWYWLFGGAFSMGVGIWSMHFVGVLAFSLPIRMSYDVPITLASVLPAMAASGLALLNFRYRVTNLRTLFVSAALMGGGIAAMHYTGMAAMRMQPPIRYDPALYTLSVAIAIMASAAALWMGRFFLSAGLKAGEIRRKTGSAILMGCAIAGMHYIGMAAANFAPDSVCMATEFGIDAAELGILVGTGTVVVLAMTLMVSIFDARLTGQTQQMLRQLKASNEELRSTQVFLSSIVDNMPNMVFVKDAAQLRFVRFNKAGERMLGFPEAELLGKSDYDFFPKEQADFFVAKDRETLAKKNEVMIQEEPVKTAGGVDRILYTKKLPILDSGGNPQYLLGISEDITERKRIEDALRESESRLDLALEASGHAAWDFDFTSGSVRFSRHWWSTLGYAPDEVPMRIEAWEKLTHPDDVAQVKTALALHLKGAVPVLDVEYRMQAKSGEWRWIQTVGRVVERDAAGRAVRGTGTHGDVTLRKLQEEKIARLSRIHALLSGVNSAIVRIRNRDELLNEACQIAVRQGGFRMVWIGFVDPQTLEVRPAASAGHEQGYLKLGRWSANPDDPIGQDLPGSAIRSRHTIVLADFEKELGAANREAALACGFRSAIALPLVVEGEAIGLMCIYSGEPGAFVDEEVKLLNELAGDISFSLEYIAKSEKLNYLAYYNALTGLPNRSLLQDYLNRVLRRAREEGTGTAVLMCDVKRFRHINETLGRQAGDALLRELAQRLKRLWPEPDNLGHIAGDCFCGLLANIGGATEIAHLVEESIGDALSAPFEIDGNELRIGMVAGIALFPADGEDAGTLLENAESALKRAKAAGEPYLFYHRQMNEAVAETLSLENRLRKAVEQQQFILHYQPKLDLATRQISGLEALIRWQDPESGLIPPGKFIPLLEETGLILDVGGWAMRQALADYRDWHNRGLQPPRIAVNVSSIQLQQKNFTDVVAGAIKEFAIMPPGLDLEITESQIMKDMEGNIGKLQALRDMGVNIAIDDFGTGYSSLGYLARLPVSALKIDRSFVITMTKNPESMAIVSTIISLAHSLDLKVIAEGVETEEESRFLRLLKCDELQGYIFNEPLPAERLTAMLERRGAEKAG